MTDELRERVARAMMERGHPDRDWGGLSDGSRTVFLEYADAALSVSPWLPIPPVPVEGVAPWDGLQTLVGWRTKFGQPMWFVARFLGKEWFAGGEPIAGPDYYQPIAPLPAAPTGER